MFPKPPPKTSIFPNKVNGVSCETSPSTVFHLHPAPSGGANTYVDHLLYECASQSGAGFLPPSYHIKLNTVCTNQQNATYNGPANWPSLPSCSSPPASCARYHTKSAFKLSAASKTLKGFRFLRFAHASKKNLLLFYPQTHGWALVSSCAWTGPDGAEMANAADASEDQCINLVVCGKASLNRPLRLTWRVLTGR